MSTHVFNIARRKVNEYYALMASCYGPPPPTNQMVCLRGRSRWWNKLFRLFRQTRSKTVVIAYSHGCPAAASGYHNYVPYGQGERCTNCRTEWTDTSVTIDTDAYIPALRNTPMDFKISWPDHLA